MRLKKLSLIGFKSFADKVVLDFDCEIIGVVGPNGCGKSNIVDAVRWVMGEQSAKSLRGDKMHDVLFAGSSQRKPLNYAEVALTFTDIQGELPTPYDEITITRRLYRNGESEYLLNRQPVRLRDIQGLFLGSGVGKNALSIFEQGKLDQVIHLSPTDRRVIFDEAAGTSRFLQRKKETLRKLTAVSENYQRVHDIHTEVERQTKQLKKQASHAKNFQECKHRLAELEKNVLLYRLCAIYERNASFDEKLNLLKEEGHTFHSQITSLEHSLEEIKKDLEQKQIQTNTKQKQLSLAETKYQVLLAEIKQHKQHLFDAKRREEDVEKHLRELGEQGQGIRQEMSKKEELLAKLAEKKNALEVDLKEKTATYTLLEIGLSQLRDVLKETQKNHLVQLQEEGKLRTKFQEKKLRFEADHNRLTALKNIEAEKNHVIESLEKETIQQKMKVTALSNEIDHLQKQAEISEIEVQKIRKASVEIQNSLSQTSQQATESSARKKVLERLREDLEGFSSGAKVILKEAKNPKSVLYKKISPLFESLIPKKGYEKILANAMRPYAETLVVENDSDVKEVLEFAKKKKLTDFSIFAKTFLKDKSKKSAKKTLSSNALAHHFAQGITIVEEGNFSDHFGVFFKVGEKENEKNTFLREAELTSLSETLKELDARLEELEKQKENLHQQLKTTEEKRNQIQEKRRKKEMDLVQENFSLQRALTDLEKEQKSLLSLQQEREKLDCLKEEEKDIDDFEQQCRSKQDEAKALLMAMKEKEQRLETKETELKQSLVILQESQTKYQKSKAEWQSMDQAIKIEEAREQERESHKQKLLKELCHLKKSVEESLSCISIQENESNSLQKGLRVLESSSKENEQVLAETLKQRELLEKELTKVRKTYEELEKQRHLAEIALAEESVEKKTIEHELIQRHSLTLHEIAAPKYHLEEGIEETEKEIRLLQSSLDKAGAVNMTAIEEFQEKQDRFNYLDQQLKDLAEAKADLEKVIAKLDQESRKIFKKTFLQIRENFQKNFSILFNGGSADLTFTDSTDILEAGIEIIAKPPGKQMRSISLLSGGEKCLTALALLFSIFEVKPAPFCILDEVDAPLDDSNIERFTNVLKQFIDKTQFIIVTHNKKTMEIADLLIGVSMEEKGVSKLISLSFEKRGESALV